MSGFFAVVHFDGAPVESPVIERMMQRIRYKGPDGEGVWQGEGVAIGMTQMRVSTFDRSDAQPLVVGNLVIAADARLYGRQELCDALRTAGQEAEPTLPDIVLIARAFQAWGERCVEYFLGEFSFVIWDPAAKQLFAARDHFGSRPLFYARVGTALVLSNTLGAVRKHPAVSPDLNELAIADFLLFGDPAWEDNSSTSYRDIRRLKPAHTLIAREDALNTALYWMLPLDEPMLRLKTRQEYIDVFRQALRQVVRERLDADRIVLNLSGGMDSTSIAALAADLVRKGEVSTELSAFTVVYDRIHPDTEAFYARLTAQMWDIPLEFTPVDEYTLKPPFTPDIEPTMMLSPGFVRYFITKQWSLGRVLMSGNGSDEILFETPLYEVLSRLPANEALDLYRWMWRFDKKRPSMGGLGKYLRSRLRSSLRGTPAEKLPVFPEWISEELAQTYHLRERWRDHHTRKEVYQHKLHPRGYHYATRAPWELALEFYDGSTPTGSVVTTPFLDIRLMRLAMQLPPSPWNHQKYILRQAMRDTLPREVLQRPKTAIGLVLSSMLRDKDAAWVDHWQPIPMTERFVRRDRIPPIYNGAADPAGEHLHIRPLFLNIWLQSYTAAPS